MTELSSFELPFLGGQSEPERQSDPEETAEREPDAVEIHLQDLSDMLEHHFRDDPRTFVGSDVAIYYEEGNPAAAITPDLFILRDDGKSPRPGHFKVWESGASPAAVIEVSASATREDDLGLKRDVCESFAVGEYFLYDPLGEYLDPPFRGYRLVGREYRILAPEADGSVVSELGLSFRVDGGRLTIVDVTTGEPLMPAAEAFEELERLRGDIMRMLGE